jgi:hypothetical protein
MTKQEFLDKIDDVRVMTNHLFVTEDDGEEWQDEAAQVIKTLGELRSDAELLLEEEYDAGYELGLNRSENLKE